MRYPIADASPVVRALARTRTQRPRQPQTWEQNTDGSVTVHYKDGSARTFTVRAIVIKSLELHDKSP